MKFQEQRFQLAIKAGCAENAALFWMYRGFYRLSEILIRLRVNANQITFLSLGLSLAALGVLFVNQPILFLLLWIFGVGLDLCDGMVARLTGKNNDGPVDLDSLCDLIKIGTSCLAIQLYWDSRIISLTITVFLVLLIVHRHLNSVRNARVLLLKSRPVSSALKSSDFRGQKPRGFRAYVLVPFATFDAHSLLLIAITPVSSLVSLLTFTYFSAVLSVQILRIFQRSMGKG